MSLDPLSIATLGFIGGGPIGVALDGFVTGDEVVVAIRSSRFRVVLLGAAAYASHMIAVCYDESAAFVTGFSADAQLSAIYASDDSDRTRFAVEDTGTTRYDVVIEDC